MSYSCSSCVGKSSVLITIDFPCRPALKAMLFTSLNLLSIMPGTPSKAANGGTAPGSTPNFFTSSSLHMRLFLANSSTLRNLLQLIFRSARYSSRQIESLPLTSMVFEPHSSGVFLSSADSLQVLVAACSMTSNLMQLAVRQLTILLYTCESQMCGSGTTSYYFYINPTTIKFNTKTAEINGNQEFSLKRMRLGYDQLKEQFVVDLELFLSDAISLKVG